MDQEILDKINKRLEALEKVYCRYQGPKGPKGDKGDPGPVGPPGKDGRDGRDGVDGVSNIPGPAGRDGRDGADGRVVVGQVVGGHFAAATVRVDDDTQTQIIDLVLPRGETGPAGRDASREDIRKIVIEVLSSDEMRGAFRGETGAPGRDGKNSTVPGPRGEVGPAGSQGPRGDSPMLPGRLAGRPPATRIQRSSAAWRRQQWQRYASQRQNL